MNKAVFSITKKHAVRLALATITPLLIPLIAMQFTSEVSWAIGDFIVAAILLFGSGYLFEILTKNSDSLVKKAITGVIVLASLILVWVVLAVDLI